jgi:mono/diheme cytochrome c family protein
LIDSNPTVIDRDEKPGHRTYVLSGCSGCHGSSAQGTVWGPALRGPYDSETLQRWLTNRSSEMYRRAKTLRLLWPFLNGHDIEVLVEYLSTREQPSARPTLVAR